MLPRGLPSFPTSSRGSMTETFALTPWGSRSVRYPVAIRGGGGWQRTIATLALTVSLPAAAKGTHMSRFIELLEAQSGALDQQGLRAILLQMLDRLNARSGSIEMRFPYFVTQDRAGLGGKKSRSTTRSAGVVMCPTRKVLVFDARDGAGDQPMPVFERDLRVRRPQSALAYHHRGRACGRDGDRRVDRHR